MTVAVHPHPITLPSGGRGDIRTSALPSRIPLPLGERGAGWGYHRGSAAAFPARNSEA